MVTRSHLVSILKATFVSVSLIISVAYVANPERTTRILNIAQISPGDGGGGGWGGGGGGSTTPTENPNEDNEDNKPKKDKDCFDECVTPDDCEPGQRCSRNAGGCKVCRGTITPTPNTPPKPKESSTPTPEPAKSAAECDQGEFFFTDIYGNSACYPEGSSVQNGYIICQKEDANKKKYLDICKDTDKDGTADVHEPLADKTSSKGCTFTGSNNQLYSIAQGESVSGGAAYNYNNNSNDRRAIRVCHNGNLVQCTPQLNNQYPQLGGCSKATIQPSNSAEARDNENATCYLNGQLIPSGRVSGNQRCTNGHMANSPYDPTAVANWLLDPQNNSLPNNSFADQAEAEAWLLEADPTTYQNYYQSVLAQREINEIRMAHEARDAAEAKKQADAEAAAKAKAEAEAAAKAAAEKTAFENTAAQYAQSQGTTLSGPTIEEKKKNCEQTCRKTYSGPDEETRLQNNRMCVLDAAGNYKCVDANINFDASSLGVNKPIGSIPQNELNNPLSNPIAPQAPVACGGIGEPSCQSGFGSLTTGKKACNTGMIPVNGRCQYDTALAQATGINNLIGQTIKAGGGEMDPDTYAAIINNNAAANPGAVARMGEANDPNEGTCVGGGTWTYSDTKKNYTCVTPEKDDVPINADFPDSGNFGQPCRKSIIGLFGGKCNDDRLTCQNNNCVLTDQAKNLIAATSSSSDPNIINANLTSINGSALPLTTNSSLAESGCTKSKTVYQQNGNTWICWDTDNKVVSQAPSDEYLTNTQLQKALFSDVAETTKPIAQRSGPKGGVATICPEGLVLLNDLCVDKKVAAFDENYSQGIIASAITNNEVINQLPITNFIADHILAPVVRAITPSYYEAAATQAEVAWTMLENRPADEKTRETRDEILDTLSPAAKIMVTTQGVTVFEWDNEKTFDANLGEAASDGLYHVLAGASLFTSAWTEGGFTGPEQSSFLNYATAFADPNAGFGQKLGSSALFGVEITMVAADVIPLDKVFSAGAKATAKMAEAVPTSPFAKFVVKPLSNVLDSPRLAQAAFDASRPGKVVTGLMEMATASIMGLGGGNIRPIQYFTDGLKKVTEGFTGKAAKEVAQETVEESALRALREAGETSAEGARKIFLEQGLTPQNADALTYNIMHSSDPKLSGLIKKETGDFADIINKPLDASDTIPPAKPIEPPAAAAPELPKNAAAIDPNFKTKNQYFPGDNNFFDYPNSATGIQVGKTENGNLAIFRQDPPIYYFDESSNKWVKTKSVELKENLKISFDSKVISPDEKIRLEAQHLEVITDPHGNFYLQSKGLDYLPIGQALTDPAAAKTLVKQQNEFIAEKTGLLTMEIADESGQKVSVLISPNDATVSVGGIDYLVTKSKQNSVYLINPETKTVTYVPGSSNWWVRTQETFDKFFAGFTKKYDSAIDNAANDLLPEAKKFLQDPNFPAAKINALTTAGVPPYMIDEKMLGKVDGALEKSLAENVQKLPSETAIVTINYNTKSVTKEPLSPDEVVMKNPNQQGGYKTYQEYLDFNFNAPARFYEKYGGQEGIPKFIKYTELGGYEIELIPGVSLKEFTGTLTQDEVNAAIAKLQRQQTLTGLAHGDLYPENILVETLSDGTHEIHFIDYRGDLPAYSTPLLKQRSIDDLKQELGKFVSSPVITINPEELIANKRPIPASIIQEKQLPLPEGYILEGNTYIYHSEIDAAKITPENIKAAAAEGHLPGGADQPKLKVSENAPEISEITGEIDVTDTHFNHPEDIQGLKIATTVDGQQVLIQTDPNKYLFYLDENGSWVYSPTVEIRNGQQFTYGGYLILEGNSRRETQIFSIITDDNNNFYLFDSIKENPVLSLTLPAKSTDELLAEGFEEFPIIENVLNKHPDLYKKSYSEEDIVRILVNDGYPPEMIDQSLLDYVRHDAPLTSYRETYNNIDLTLYENFKERVGREPIGVADTAHLPKLEKIPAAGNITDEVSAPTAGKWFNNNVYSPEDGLFPNWKLAQDLQDKLFKRGGSLPTPPSTFSKNAQLIVDPQHNSEFTKVLNSESIGGWAGEGYGAVNCVVDKKGNIVYFGNYSNLEENIAKGLKDGELFEITINTKVLPKAKGSNFIVTTSDKTPENIKLLLKDFEAELNTSDYFITPHTPTQEAVPATWWQKNIHSPDGKWFPSLRQIGVPAAAGGMADELSAPTTGNWFNQNIYNSSDGILPKLSPKAKALTIGAGAGGVISWIGYQAGAFDKIAEVISQFFQSFFNPQPVPEINSTQQAPTTMPPAQTQTQEPPSQAKTPAAEINGYALINGANAPSDIAAQAAFIGQLIIDFYSDPQNCTDTSLACRDAFSDYLKSKIGAEYPELLNDQYFAFSLEQLVSGYGDYDQAVQCVVWDILLKGLGVNTAPISGMLGEKANDIYQVLSESNPSLSMTASDFQQLANNNNTYQQNYTYSAGENTAYLFNDFDSLQAGDCFFYGSGTGHTGCIIDITENAAGQHLFVISESNSPVGGTPTGLPETYYLTESDWDKKIGAPLPSTLILRPGD